MSGYQHVPEDDGLVVGAADEPVGCQPGQPRHCVVVAFEVVDQGSLLHVPAVDRPVAVAAVYRLLGEERTLDRVHRPELDLLADVFCGVGCFGEDPLDDVASLDQVPHLQSPVSRYADQDASFGPLRRVDVHDGVSVAAELVFVELEFRFGPLHRCGLLAPQL